MATSIQLANLRKSLREKGCTIKVLSQHEVDIQMAAAIHGATIANGPQPFHPTSSPT